MKVHNGFIYYEFEFYRIGWRVRKTDCIKPIIMLFNHSIFNFFGFFFKIKTGNVCTITRDYTYNLYSLHIRNDFVFNFYFRQNQSRRGSMSLDTSKRKRRGKILKKPLKWVPKKYND